VWREQDDDGGVPCRQSRSSDTVTADATAPRGVLGYRGARGLAIDYFFTLVPDTLQPQLLAYLDTGRYKTAGLTDADFARFGLQRLAFFRVAT
jgi:hypothetical protein